MLVEDARVVGIRGHGQSGQSVSERARVVVGADGLHSMVAKAVRPEQYHDKPPLLCGYYSYWSGLPMQGRFENYIRPDRGWAAFPTHDDLTLVVAGWRFADFAKNKVDVEGNYLSTFQLAPQFNERIHFSAPPVQCKSPAALVLCPSGISAAVRSSRPGSDSGCSGSFRS